MHTDHSIDLSFFYHPKIRKLQKWHGDGAILSLLRLRASFIEFSNDDWRIAFADTDDLMDMAQSGSDLIDSLRSLGILLNQSFCVQFIEVWNHG